MVTRRTPEGRLSEPESPRIVFSQPMVALEDTEAPAPATITPPVDGKWRWTDPCTAILDLTDRLPANTRYTVTIPMGTRSLEGGRLARDVRWSFTTRPPRLVDSWPRGHEISREPLLIAQFDQPVKQADVTIEGFEDRLPLTLSLPCNPKYGWTNTRPPATLVG